MLFTWVVLPPREEGKVSLTCGMGYTCLLIWFKPDSAFVGGLLLGWVWFQSDSAFFVFFSCMVLPPREEGKDSSPCGMGNTCLIVQL